MGLKVIDVKTAEFDGSSVILQHNNAVSESFWNKSTENSASTYYLPNVCISYNNTEDIIGADIDDLWGCIPPSNPMCDSSYGELADLFLNVAWDYTTGANARIRTYGGTDVTSMSLLDDFYLGGSAGSSIYQVGTDLAIPYYSTSGSANPYFVHVSLTRDNAFTEYPIINFDMYYRKWVDVGYTYEGDFLGTFSTATGSTGTIYGTDGTGGAIASAYTGTNLARWGISTGTFPYPAEYVTFEASAGTGSLMSGYGGDVSAHADYNYTRMSSSIIYHIGTADGTLTTQFKQLQHILDGDVYMRMWNDSGTTYANISGTKLVVGTTGTTIELGTWAGAGTAGFLTTTLAGYQWDGNTRQLIYYFACANLGGLDQIITLDAITVEDQLHRCGAVNFYTEDAPCPFGIRSNVSSWSL